VAEGPLCSANLTAGASNLGARSPLWVVAMSSTSWHKSASDPLVPPGWYPSGGALHFWNGEAWSAPPGWYPFPGEMDVERYWDGTAWTSAPKGWWYPVPGEAGVKRHWNGVAWTGLRGRRVSTGWFIEMGILVTASIVVSVWWVVYMSAITPFVTPPTCNMLSTGSMWLAWLILWVLAVAGWVVRVQVGRGNTWMLMMAILITLAPLIFSPARLILECGGEFLHDLG
jgi:hypothetical protein